MNKKYNQYGWWNTGNIKDQVPRVSHNEVVARYEQSGFGKPAVLVVFGDSEFLLLLFSYFT